MNQKTKKVLKGIVKECLIELLAEGLVGNKQATIRETRELRGTIQESYEKSSASLNETVSTSPKRSYLENIKAGIDNANSNNSVNEDAVLKQKISSITNDSVMSDILADTAKTTLREQKESGRLRGPSVAASGDKIAKLVDQSTPDELFGKNASNWAALAFSDSSSK
jgi:hypothetical protein